MKEAVYRFDAEEGHLAVTVMGDGRVIVGAFDNNNSEDADIEVSAAELYQIGTAFQTMAKLADARKMEPV